MRVQIYHAQPHLLKKTNLKLSFECIYTSINTLQVSEMLCITQWTANVY